METIAQLILLMVAYAIFKAYVEGGWVGVDQWWRAKLVGA